MNTLEDYKKANSFHNKDGYLIGNGPWKEGGADTFIKIPLTTEGMEKLIALDKEQFEKNPKVSVYIPYLRLYGFPDQGKPSTEDVFSAVRKIESNQPVIENAEWISILWNKCRYFEFSIYNKELRNFVAQSAGVKVRYNSMLVGGRLQLERVVKALNKKGYYVNINQDWI